VARQHFPKASVAMTAELYALVDRAVKNKRCSNDYAGVFHDICHMSRCYIVQKLTDGHLFQVTIRGAGRKRLYTLKVLFGVDDDGVTPAVTFMMEHED
jgi:hypothetical protein